MKCEHCKSDNLAKNYMKSLKKQDDKTKRYFRYCKGCGYNTYHNFPSYLDITQYDKYLEQTNKKGD